MQRRAVDEGDTRNCAISLRIVHIEAVDGQIQVDAVHDDTTVKMHVSDDSFFLIAGHRARDGAAFVGGSVAAVNQYGGVQRDGAGIIVRHGDLIHHSIYSHFHPLRAAERPVRGDDPFAGRIGRGKQAFVAGRHRLRLAGQANLIQDRAQPDRRIAGHHILIPIIGEFHCVRG